MFLAKIVKLQLFIFDMERKLTAILLINYVT